MDRHWWHEYAEELETFAGECWTTNTEAARVYGLNFIRGEVGNGLPKHRHDCIRLGGNSGYQAVGLAVHFGAARVVLLGYDMRNDGAQTHWHGNHKALGNPIPQKFRDWCAAFSELQRDIGDRCEIVNASRVTALQVFPRTTLVDAIDG